MALYIFSIDVFSCYPHLELGEACIPGLAMVIALAQTVKWLFTTDDAGYLFDGLCGMKGERGNDSSLLNLELLQRK